MISERNDHIFSTVIRGAECVIVFNMFINMFTALKGSQFDFLFPVTAAGVVSWGGPKKCPRTSYKVQILFSFRSFDISESILRNQKIIIGLESFSKQRFHIFAFDHIWILQVFVSTTLLNDVNYNHYLWLHVANSIGSLKRLK